jgi:hypothetical protein
MSAIRTLLTESIDYAGLFPPAGLDMPSAVRNYATYRTGPDAWALGRFVLPVSRLREFEAAAANHLPLAPAAQPWRLSVLIGPDIAADLEATTEFNDRHSHPGAPAVAADTIEAKARSESGIEEAARKVPRSLKVYIEIPIDRDPYQLITALARLGGRAKVRTGGVTEDAFPATADLVRFLRRCVQMGVAFKATAGLHHPLRAEYPLTYAADSPAGAMFGFLNVFLATAFLRDGLSDLEAARLLEERSPEAIEIDARGIAWNDHRLDLDALRRARNDGLISFGSCSFTEPLSDLAALHLLPPTVSRA